MHAASLGEFEQGRPVLKQILEKIPQATIVITFFSPSGYEIARSDKDFHLIYYLPLDSPSNAKRLINFIKPDFVLWVKYEFWHYYLRELRLKKIPVFLISGAFRKTQPFFKSYGGFWKEMLSSFDFFFLQNEASKQLLSMIVVQSKMEVSGDTRCDRVINISKNFYDVPGIKEFCRNSTVIVAGSTWEDDEAEWVHYVREHPEIKFIFAPHEVDEENIQDVLKEFRGAVRYSVWLEKKEASSVNCLIIDNVGMLSRLYAYATITYVGGGFGYDGLHNILEAAVYGKAVIFGPEYDKNFEARELMEAGGAFSVINAIELEKTVNRLLSDKVELEKSSKAAADYVLRNAGASDKIVAHLEKKGLIQN